MSPSSCSRPWRPARALTLLLALAGASAATAADARDPLRQVVVSSSRVHVGDLVPDAGDAAAKVEVCPSPAAGGSRLVTRADVVTALDAVQLPVPADVPDTVRVVRKARRLAPAEIDAIVQSSITPRELGRGVALAAVRADRSVELADGWTRVGVEVPRAPKKVGTFSVMSVASFFEGDEVIARVAIPLQVSVSQEGAAYDAPRGATVTLIVRRSLVEVRTAGFVTADADVGDSVPVELRPSGRVVQARLLSRDEALALDGVSPPRFERAFEAEPRR